MTIDRQKQIEVELSKTMGHSLYNGWHNYREKHLLGYHSYSIGDIKTKGQRDPLTRIEIFREHIDFSNKNVVDFGCNTGAMLHHLSEISRGFGIDYDQKCIDAAINITRILDRENLEFKSFNLSPFQGDLSYQFLDVKTWESHLSKTLPFNPDVVFLLSLGSWIEWKYLYNFCSNLDCEIVLETNNDKEGKHQLNFFAALKKDIQQISDNSLDDVTGNHARKTYLIR